nr:hypothetical protein [Nevskia sp.]
MNTGMVTEFPFRLPLGYIDAQGERHREGVMRLATAHDEIAPLKDPRVQANEAYLLIVLLSRVVTRLGELAAVTPKVVEGLYAGDLAYLQGLYRRVNASGSDRIRTQCPHCQQAFEIALESEEEDAGKSGATP